MISARFVDTIVLEAEEKFRLVMEEFEQRMIGERTYASEPTEPEQAEPEQYEGVGGGQLVYDL